MTHEREGGIGGVTLKSNSSTEGWQDTDFFLKNRACMGHPNGPSFHRLTNLILECVQFFHHSLVEPSISFLYLSITSSWVSISVCILITS
jgi:hypothetical protein